jgi:hypothetical protein
VVVGVCVCVHVGGWGGTETKLVYSQPKGTMNTSEEQIKFLYCVMPCSHYKESIPQFGNPVGSLGGKRWWICRAAESPLGIEAE